MYGIRLSYSSNNNLTDIKTQNNSLSEIFIQNNAVNNTFKNIQIASYPTNISFIYDSNSFLGYISIDGVDNPPPDPSDWQNISKYINITRYNGPAWLWLNISYSESDITNAGFDESTLKILKWNGSEWLESGWYESRILNTTANIVGVNITNFSVFAPFGQRPFLQLTQCRNITAPGTYYLLNNVTSSGTCFNILADNVSLHCQGHKINYSTQYLGYAINISSGKSNILIDNCVIRHDKNGVNYSHAVFGNDVSNVTFNLIDIHVDGAWSNTHSCNAFRFLNSENITIKNSTISTKGNYAYGIYLENCKNTRLENNHLNSSDGNFENHFHLKNTNNSQILNNTVYSDSFLGYPIMLENSIKNVFQDNNFTTTHTLPVFIDGGLIDHFNNTIDESNTNDGYPIKYFFNKQSFTITDKNYTSQYGYVFFGWCTNITLKNVTFGSDGLALFDVRNSSFYNITVIQPQSKGCRAINLHDSDNNELIDLKLLPKAASAPYGIALGYSDNITIKNFNITIPKNSGSWAKGISVCYPAQNLVMRNGYADVYCDYWDCAIFYFSAFGGGEVSIKNVTGIINGSPSSRRTWILHSDGGYIEVTDSNFTDYGHNDTGGTIKVLHHSKFVFRDTVINAPIRPDVYFDHAYKYANFTNVTFDQSDVRFSSDSTAKFNVFWYLNVFTNSSKESYVSNANVKAYDKTSTLRASNLTNSTGWTRLALQEYWQNATEIYYYTNYTINATHPNYRDTPTKQVNLTTNKNITLTFQNTPPTHSKPYIGAHINPSMDGLVSYWQFEYDNGTVTPDATGRNNGTLHGGVKLVHEGRVGKAYEFDGVNDYITADSVTADLANKNISIAFWLKSSDVSSNQSFFISFNNNTGGANKLLIGRNTGSNKLAIDNGTTRKTSSTVIIDDTWHFVTIIFDTTSNNIMVYIDSNYDFSVPCTNDISSTDKFSIGMEWDGSNPSDYFNGTLDEIIVFDRLLALSEIKELYNLTKGKYALKNNDIGCSPNATYDADDDNLTYIYNWYRNDKSILLLNMPFEGGSNDTFTKDYSGFGNDGTVHGASWNSTSGHDSSGAYEFDGVNDKAILYKRS